MKKAIVACLCLMFAITACKKDNTVNNTTTSPVGDWQRTSNGVINHLVFKTDQTYEVGYDDASTGVHTTSITGTYTNTTNQFTFVTSVGANACDTIKGNYGFVIAQDTFAVTTIKDGCISNGTGRTAATEGKWAR